MFGRIATGIGVPVLACIICGTAFAVADVPHSPLTSPCPNGTGVLTTPYGAPATCKEAGSMPVFALLPHLDNPVTSWPADGNWDFCAAFDTASCSLNGLWSLSEHYAPYAPFFQCTTDMNGPINPSPLPGELSVTPNGIPDGEFELGLLAAVLNNTYALDPAKTGGVTNADVLAAYKANFNFFKVLLTTALSQVPVLGIPTDQRVSVILLAPYLPTSMATVLAGYATEGNANTLAGLNKLLEQLADIGVAIPEGGVASVTTGFPSILGPGGDADGDHYTNLEEYNYFNAQGAAVTIAAELNPAVFPPAIPITGSIVINDNLSGTNNPQVTLKITWGGGSGTGVTRMRFSDDGAHWGAWETPVATRAYTLPSPPDGYKTVRVQFLDQKGYRSAAFRDYVRLDTAVPTGSILINNGASTTTSRNVSLKLKWSDGTGSGVTRMRFSDDGAHWSAWEPPVSPKAYTLPLATPGHQTVRAQFRDAVGNVSVVYNDYINLVVK